MKQNSIYKKIGLFVASIVTSLFLIVSMYSLQAEEHVHDANCGYTEAIVGHECNHIHDDTCGYVEAQKEVPCNQRCIDKDGDGLIEHSDICAYKPAIVGHSCNHIHDESCGYVEEVMGHACIYKQVENEKQDIVPYSIPDNTVTTYDELNNAIKNATGTKENPTVISLGGNTITMTNYIELFNKHVVIENGTITFDDSSLAELDGQTAFFVADATLTLRNIIIEGNHFELTELFYQQGDLILDEGTVIQNITCSRAIINGSGSSYKSTTYLESGATIRDSIITKSNSPYILLSYAAKLHLNGALLDGPGMDSKTPAIYCSSTSGTLDIIANGGTIQNFYSGIYSSNAVCINDIMINNTDIGIDLNGDTAIVDFKGGTIQDCHFAGVRLQYAGTFTMSGGIITRCTSDPKYPDSGAISMSTKYSTLNLTGGKIVDNFANGVCTTNGIINISGNLEISGNKTGVKSKSDATLNMLGGNILNNEVGVDMPYMNCEIQLGGSAQIENNRDGDLCIPIQNTTYNNITIVQDFTEDAHISVTPTMPLSKGETLQVALPDASYHSGQLIGNETEYVSSSNPDYHLIIKDNEMMLEYKDTTRTVSFVTNSNQTLEDIKVLSGTVIKEPVLTKVGYTLEGWYRDIDFTDKWNFASDIVNQSMTLYAKWKPIEYHIRYTLNEGSAIDNPVTYTVETPTFSLHEPTKTGYTFLGWVYGNSTQPQKDVAIVKGTTGDKAFEAKWRINTYSVHFDTNGGGAIDLQKVTYGSKAIKPNNPMKADCLFLGWYQDIACTQEWNFDTKISKDTILYAKYQNVVKAPTASISSGSKVNIGNSVVLTTSTPEARIYYTTDGSIPSKNSILYHESIQINEDMTIKAIAIKEGYANSEIASFTYRVSGEVKVDIKVSGDGNITVPKDEDIIDAVLGDDDYQHLKSGKDITITLKCETLATTDIELHTSHIQDHQIGQYLDISIYKQVGDKQHEQITNLQRPIDITVQVPDQLLPEKSVKRTYSLIRIHDDEQTLLNDKDLILETVTVESDRFSTYVLIYKDEKQKSIDDTNQGIVDTSDHYGNTLQYMKYMFISLIGVIYLYKKETL